MSTISPVFTKSKSNNISHNPISKRDREIQNLLEQRNKLNEQLNEIRTNEEMNDEIKKDRIKSLQESIQQLEAQVSQIRADEMEEKNKKNQLDSSKEAKPSNKEKNNSLDSLLYKAQSYNQLGKLIGVVNQKTHIIRSVEGEVRSDRLTHTLPHEINNDKDIGKSVMLQNADMTVFQKKREFVQNEKAKINKIEQKISEIVEDVNERHSLQNEKIVPESQSDKKSNTTTDDRTGSNIKESQQSSDTIKKSIDIRV